MFMYERLGTSSLDYCILPRANPTVIPVTMETRSSKVIFLNYSKKKPAEDTLVPPLWGTRGKNVRF